MQHRRHFPGGTKLGLLADLYRPSLALLTDLYQITMAYSFWKAGLGDHEAAFNLLQRSQPFGGGYTVCCGLEPVIDYLNGFRFLPEDLEYLDGLTGNDDSPLFEQGFLDYLGAMKFSCDVDAIPEGTVVIPPEPVLTIRGPIVQCQILETPLLNTINFQSLIATKAARICSVTENEPVIEFGLRRAQGVDGGLSASRAAFVGGCAATSNLLAGRLLGIPVRGTHAHSWVMFFDSELEAFLEYARHMPNNAVFLVDTYDTLEGVRHAIEAGRVLREQGHRLAGIRLDSGDLAYLSIEARKMLDAAGFPNADIVASNDLDERIIDSLKQQGAEINVWGVGTRLVTGYEQSSLGGVYKLSAIREPGGDWQYRLKLSEQSAKTSYPGILQARRFHGDGEFIADVIYDRLVGLGDSCTLVDPMDPTRRRTIPAGTAYEDLQVPVFRQGRQVYTAPPLESSRDRTREQLDRFHAGIKRFMNPHAYPVGLDLALHELRTRLTLETRET
jgi:nicotinate phosphoribosyltransferase